MCVLFGPLQLLLANQLEMEKMKVEQEKKKCYLAQEALKEKVLHEKTRLCSCSESAFLLIFSSKKNYNYHFIQDSKITPSSYNNNSAIKSTHFKSLKFRISVFLFHQERKSLSLSVTDAPASSTPSLSRSSSVSGAEHAGLPSSISSQVHSSHPC